MLRSIQQIDSQGALLASAIGGGAFNSHLDGLRGRGSCPETVAP